MPPPKKLTGSPKFLSSFLGTGLELFLFELKFNSSKNDSFSLFTGLGGSKNSSFSLFSGSGAVVGTGVSKKSSDSDSGSSSESESGTLPKSKLLSS